MAIDKDALGEMLDGVVNLQVSLEKHGEAAQAFSLALRALNSQMEATQSKGAKSSAQQAADFIDEVASNFALLAQRINEEYNTTQHATQLIEKSAPDILNGIHADEPETRREMTNLLVHINSVLNIYSFTVDAIDRARSTAEEYAPLTDLAVQQGFSDERRSASQDLVASTNAWAHSSIEIGLR